MKISIGRTLTSITSSKRRIAIALSGGVDSSVAAYLLCQNNTNDDFDELVGLFMNNWDARDESSSSDAIKNYCEQSEKDFRDAQSVCDSLAIKLHRANFSSEYWINVFSPFIEEVEKGRMLNPDVACNSMIKFGAMKRYAVDRLNSTHVATGHYARLWYRENMNAMPRDVEHGLEEDECCNDWIETWGSKSISKNSTLFPLLLAGVDLSKDQSYFLSSVTGEAFRDVLFPLGDLSKQSYTTTTNDNEIQKESTYDLMAQASSNITSVREIASFANLSNAKKRESMGICFIGKRRFNHFISDYLTTTPLPGRFVCVETQSTVGTHDGSAMLLTVGQGAKISGASQKWFVCDKDYSSGDIHVCQGTHHPALYSNELYVIDKDWSWVGMEAPPPLIEGKSVRAHCRIRHLQPLIPCEVKW